MYLTAWEIHKAASKDPTTSSQSDAQGVLWDLQRGLVYSVGNPGCTIQSTVL